MDSENILIEKKNHIAILSLNRESILNALNTEVLREFNTILDNIENDEDVYVVIITGKGKAFVAGADIFDGLTWLRYSYHDGYTIYWQNYGASKMIQVEDKKVRLKSAIDNIYYLATLQEQLKRFSSDGNFECLVGCDQLVKDAYNSE